MCFFFVSCVLTEDPESVEERKGEEAYFDIQEAGGWWRWFILSIPAPHPPNQLAKETKPRAVKRVMGMNLHE